MTYSARVICDSIAQGTRLTTMEVVFPRIVLAEFNTHRMLSRNSASSRAIPVEKRIAAVRENPFIPEAFAANKKGMQAGDVLDRLDQDFARSSWKEACDDALRHAEALVNLGVHKQWANRLLEPFSWHTVVVTATEWENFFNLRISALAQPEIYNVAVLMKEALDKSTPVVRDNRGELRYHLPYLQEDELVAVKEGDAKAMERAIKISTARCARVSYLTQNGIRDPEEDLKLHDRLLGSRHMSPFEHVAYASIIARTATQNDFCGNFRHPWVQYRKMIHGEAVAPREEPEA